MNLILKTYKKFKGLSYPYPKIQRDISKFAQRRYGAEEQESFEKESARTAVLNEMIDISLLTLNRLEDTKRTLGSLYKTTLPFHLIIIDQKSDDGTREFVQEFSTRHDNVSLILAENNLGVSGGRALAVSHTETDYLAFIDNDMIFAPGYFENLLKTLVMNEDVAGVFAKVALPNSRIEVNSPKLSKQGKWVVFSDEDSGKFFDDPTTLLQMECMWIPMGASMWRTDVLKKIRIDSELIGGYEDNEYTYRVAKSGHKLLNCPSSIVLHIKAEFTRAMLDTNYTQGRFSAEKLRFAVKRFYEKHNLYFAFGNIKGHCEYLGFDTPEEYIKFLTSN